MAEFCAKGGSKVLDSDAGARGITLAGAVRLSVGGGGLDFASL